MKNIIRIVLTQDDVEKIVKNHIQSSIPKDAKVFYKHDRKWEEFSTYRKDSEDCIMFEFSIDDVEKESEISPVGEKEWDSEELYL